MIVVVDYKMGNVGSIANMLKRIGAPAAVSADLDQIRAADRLILPGVGAFDNGMQNLESMGLLPVLEERVRRDGTPILGICLGMQMFTRGSQEGSRRGLGWLAADTVKFRPEDPRLKVPHMGWNTVHPARPATVFEGLDEDAAFYFVHSYHVVCDRPEDVLATTRHGCEFASAVQQGNILGMQFHPEKSHAYGMHVLRRFAGLPC